MMYRACARAILPRGESIALVNDAAVAFLDRRARGGVARSISCSLSLAMATLTMLAKTILTMLATTMLTVPP